EALPALAFDALDIGIMRRQFIPVAQIMDSRRAGGGGTQKTVEHSVGDGGDDPVIPPLIEIMVREMMTAHAKQVSVAEIDPPMIERVEIFVSYGDEKARSQSRRESGPTPP